MNDNLISGISISKSTGENVSYLHRPDVTDTIVSGTKNKESFDQKIIENREQSDSQRITLLDEDFYKNIQLNDKSLNNLESGVNFKDTNLALQKFYQKRLTTKIIQHSKFLHQGISPKSFGKAHDVSIKAITLTEDSKYVITSDINGTVKIFLLKKRKLVKSLGRVHECAILAIACSNEIIITSGVDGTIKQFNMKDIGNIECYNYGKVHDDKITT